MAVAAARKITSRSSGYRSTHCLIFFGFHRAMRHAPFLVMTPASWSTSSTRSRTLSTLSPVPPSWSTWSPTSRVTRVYHRRSDYERHTARRNHQITSESVAADENTRDDRSVEEPFHGNARAGRVEKLDVGRLRVSFSPGEDVRRRPSGESLTRVARGRSFHQVSERDCSRP